jgi:predicted transcriptional regulator
MNKINKLILEELRDKDIHKIGEISNKTNKPLTGLFYAIQNLIINKEVEKVEYGTYKITEIGIKSLELEDLRNEKN